ncbi:MAG TPA: hypothetical protein VFX20_03165 [Steroidobacteraceae bacterium]|nr:hypothetical protein [Steroidobacteraceae bacterium]
MSTRKRNLRVDQVPHEHLRAGVASGGWTAGVFVKNLFNRAADYGDVVTAAEFVPGQTRFVVAQPRTRRLGAAPELWWRLIRSGGHVCNFTSALTDII